MNFKTCKCGQTYPTPQAFLTLPAAEPHNPIVHQDGHVQFFRQCACGSTLLEEIPENWFNVLRVHGII